MTAPKILLVDDEPNLLLMVGDQLRLEGYDVVTAASGDEALQTLRFQPPDLIVLDISMPGMTGLALLKKLSGPDGAPRYPILIFTARANMEQFFQTTEVEGFLTKASDPTKLLSEVKRILLKTRKIAPPETPPASASKPHRTVLILEDDPTLNMRLKISFSIAGYETLTLTDSHLLSGTLQAHTPHIILLKLILRNTTGADIATSLADYTTAKGIPIILYDSSGIHNPTKKFVNVDKFVPSNVPAELLKATAALLG
jgi:DNA-binding response OmpR family regulator